MSKIRFVGLDVHAETIAVAVAEPGGEVRSPGIIASRLEPVRRGGEVQGGMSYSFCGHSRATRVCSVAITLALIAVIAAGQSNVVNSAKINSTDGLQYVWIPPGTFTMGCSTGDAECGRGEPAPHPVTISRGFWIGKTEVPAGAYRLFASATTHDMPPEPPFNAGWHDRNRPVVNVTWNDAAAYCKWTGGRLPSEEEWEYAARAGSPASRYGLPNDISWFADNNDKTGPHPVGQKQANAWGLSDTLGNVWEWTSGKYPLTGQNDGPNLPANPDVTFWAIRGGSWYDAARLIRVSVRGRAETAHRSDSIGIRCVSDNSPV